MHAAIVTGVSRGLGEALALALLARRAHVLGVGRRSSARLSGAHYRFVECDLAAPGRIAAVVLPALRELAALPLSAVTLINNAAVATPLGRAGQLDIGAADASFATNVTAPLALVDLFLKSFDPALERRVLNISSGAAQRAIPGSAVYCMSKAALEMLTKVVADMQALLREQDPATFPSAPLYRGFKESGTLKDPATVATRIVERLIAAPVEHGRIYGHADL
jgi:benzil reductase ((S)-benzoin forming)